jgi:hypothetical protein
MMPDSRPEGESFYGGRYPRLLVCWCGHSYHNHTDSDTPACYWPLDPEGDDGFWERTDEAVCQCDGWYPMNEDAPEDPPFPLSHRV